jgi:protease IV
VLEKSMQDENQALQNAPAWERKTIEKLLLATLREQRAKRRWSIFFRLCFLALAIAFLWAILVDDPRTAWGGGETVGAGKHTAVVSLEGTIEADSPTASAEAVNASLRAAFADPQTAGVILRISSPGGSPVQSQMMFDEIRRLRAKYAQIPLHVVVEEICASGGYFVAAAGDSIHVSKSSMIGSIGVIMDGFGFSGAMSKLGIERRALTAGENKGFMDPFSPMLDRHKEHITQMLGEIHEQFIAAVKTGRGSRLKQDQKIFSGLVFTGASSIQLGLADALGTVDSVARDVIKAEEMVDYSPRDNVAERLARRFGATVGSSFAAALKAGSHTLQLR